MVSVCCESLDIFGKPCVTENKWVESSACSPLTWAIETIKNVNNYAESCSWHTKHLLRFSSGLALGIALFPLNVAVTLTVTTIVIAILGKNRWNAYEEKAPMYGGKFPSMFSACIIAPIAEELIFRFGIYYIIKKPIQFTASFFCGEETANKIGAITAIAFTSLAFGLAHAVNSKSIYVALPQIVQATLVGVIHGCEKEFGGGILMSIGSHMANNTIVSLLLRIIKE